MYKFLWKGPSIDFGSPIRQWQPGAWPLWEEVAPEINTSATADLIYGRRRKQQLHWVRFLHSTRRENSRMLRSYLTCSKV